jgi:hypothetical protein
MPCLCHRTVRHFSRSLRAISPSGGLRDSISPARRRAFLLPGRSLHDGAGAKLPPRSSFAQLNERFKDDTEPAEKVRIQGLVRSIRKQKNVAFVAIRDGTTFDSYQAILHPDKAKEYGCERIPNLGHVLTIPVQYIARCLRGSHGRMEEFAHRGKTTEGTARRIGCCCREVGYRSMS